MQYRSFKRQERQEIPMQRHRTRFFPTSPVIDLLLGRYTNLLQRRSPKVFIGRVLHSTFLPICPFIAGRTMHNGTLPLLNFVHCYP